MKHPKKGDGLVHPLRKARLDADLTVSELADRVGVSRQLIYALEQGIRRGSLETWLKISQALDVPVDTLVGDQGKVSAG